MFRTHFFTSSHFSHSCLLADPSLLTVLGDGYKFRYCLVSQGLDEAQLLMDKLQGEKRALFMEGGDLRQTGYLKLSSCHFSAGL